VEVVATPRYPEVEKAATDLKADPEVADGFTLVATV